MKKLIALLLAFICLFGYAIGDSPATPTDLDEGYEIIDDDDWGSIEIERERKVYVDANKTSYYFGDQVILVAVLVDFKPEDKVTFQWLYAVEEEADWIFIEDATEQTYTFILDKTNYKNWYRVVVTLEGI